MNSEWLRNRHRLLHSTTDLDDATNSNQSNQAQHQQNHQYSHEQYELPRYQQQKRRIRRKPSSASWVTRFSRRKGNEGAFVLVAFTACFLSVSIAILIVLPHIKNDRKSFGSDVHGPLGVLKGQLNEAKNALSQKLKGSPLVKRDNAGNLSPFQVLQQKEDINNSKQKEDKNQLQQSRHSLLPVKCQEYGCPIYPMEISHLQSPSFFDQTFNNSTTAKPLNSDDEKILHLSLSASRNHILLTHKSNRINPPLNQDRAVLIAPFGNTNTHQIQQELQTKINPHKNFFIGLFDGHDDKGQVIAQFASEEVPSRVASKLKKMQTENRTLLTGFSSDANSRNEQFIATTIQQQQQEAIKQILVQSFIEVDHDAPPTEALIGGCTGIAVLRWGSTIYLANTGDSTVMLVTYHPPKGGVIFDQKQKDYQLQYQQNQQQRPQPVQLQGMVTIHNQNQKHKANFPAEKSRIEALGGRIHIPPQRPMGSRVIVRSSVHKEDVGLAMSRSIGDWEWGAVGVIPDPDVVAVDLDKFFADEVDGDGKAFVVVGSDGLFDARKVEFVARHLAYAFFESISPAVTSPDGSGDENYTNKVLTVGRNLVTLASPVKPETYRDDITFVSMVIEQ